MHHVRRISVLSTDFRLAFRRIISLGGVLLGLLLCTTLVFEDGGAGEVAGPLAGLLLVLRDCAIAVATLVFFEDRVWFRDRAFWVLNAATATTAEDGCTLLLVLYSGADGKGLAEDAFILLASLCCSIHVRVAHIFQQCAVMAPRGSLWPAMRSMLECRRSSISRPRIPTGKAAR